MRHAVIAAALLVGCATEPQQRYVWAKPNSSLAEFQADSGYCRAQAWAAPGPLTPGVVAQRTVAFEGCLQGRGWYQVPQ